MSNIETKETITFDEFRAWLTGLIRGMDGQLPGAEEWKMIKQMMDKVVPDVERVSEPVNPPYAPMPTPSPWPYQRRKWFEDTWPHYRIWCDDRTGGVGYNSDDIVTNDALLSNANSDQTSSSFTASGQSSQDDVGEQLSLAIDQMVHSNIK